MDIKHCVKCGVDLKTRDNLFRCPKCRESMPSLKDFLDEPRPVKPFRHPKPSEGAK